MYTLILISLGVLLVAVLFVGFLLLGALRALGLLGWRLDQLEAITPSRIGRSGLKPGAKAPDFILPSVTGEPLSLHDFSGHKVLLVFVQGGCEPCHLIVPELNRLGASGTYQVMAVHSGKIEAAQEWAREAGALFPVGAQDHWNVSKRYEMYATPFAFLLDEQGLIVSRGIVKNAQHIKFVLSEALPSDLLRKLAQAESMAERADEDGGEPAVSSVNNGKSESEQ